MDPIAVQSERAEEGQRLLAAGIPISAGDPACRYLVEHRQLPADVVLAAPDLLYLPSAAHGRGPTDHAVLTILRAEPAGEPTGLQATWIDIAGAPAPTSDTLHKRDFYPLADEGLRHRLLVGRWRGRRDRCRRRFPREAARVAGCRRPGAHHRLRPARLAEIQAAARAQAHDRRRSGACQRRARARWAPAAPGRICGTTAPTSTTGCSTASMTGCGSLRTRPAAPTAKTPTTSGGRMAPTRVLVLAAHATQGELGRPGWITRLARIDDDARTPGGDQGGDDGGALPGCPPV